MKRYLIVLRITPQFHFTKRYQTEAEAEAETETEGQRQEAETEIETEIETGTHTCVNITTSERANSVVKVAGGGVPEVSRQATCVR